MKQVLLAILFGGIILSTGIVSAQEANIIPPTNAFTKIITSNGTITAKNYTGHLNIGGSGITVTSSNNEQKLYLTVTGGAGLTKIQGSNLGTHGIGPFASNFNASMLQFFSLLSLNSNCVVSSNSTNVLLNCSTGGTQGKGIIINGLNRTSFSGISANGTAGKGILLNGVNRTSFINAANTTQANNFTQAYLNFINNPIILTPHRVIAPTNASGTICLRNQTGACGTSSGGSVTINGNLRPSFISVANTTSANTINTHSVSFASNQTGTLCERNQTGTCGQINVNSKIRYSFSGVANTTAANVFSTNNDFGQGTTQIHPNTGLLIRNPASTFGTTIKGGAVTSNQTQTLSITTSPSTIAVVPFYNFTSKNQTTGTTSIGVQQMYGGGVTFIPRTGTNATVSVSFINLDSTLGDGCKTDIRWGTGGVHGTNTALAGTLVGSNMKSMSPTTASLPQSNGKTVLITGLTAGTKYYADLSYSAITGGTCQVYNVDWYVMAP